MQVRAPLGLILTSPWMTDRETKADECKVHCANCRAQPGDVDMHNSRDKLDTPSM